MLFDWPSSATFGRVIPKSRIYEQVRAGASLRRQFVKEVERITWACKLAPETVNLPATKEVPEIQVLHLTSRVPDLPESVLRAIDRAIPFPVIFELHCEGRARTLAAPKRPYQADASRWTVGEYYRGSWVAEDAPRIPVPVVLNLGALYEHILTTLIRAHVGSLQTQLTDHEPNGAFAGHGDGAKESPLPLEEMLALAERIRGARREVEKLQRKLAQTRQFNRRVELNARLRTARQHLQQLLARMQGNDRRGETHDEA